MTVHEHDHTHHDHHDHDHHDHEHDDHHHEHHGTDWGRIQAWAQTGIMFLLALYLIDLSLPGGNLNHYINVRNFGWLTWVGAAILLAITAINVVDLLRNTSVEDGHNHDEEDDHNHGRAGSLASWVVLGLAAVPLVLGLGIPSKPLGAEAISGEVSADVRSLGLSGQASTINIPNEQRNILDWIRAFASTPDLTEFQGQEISVIGFVYRDARFEDTEDFMIVRFTLSCCVADARPLGLVVENPGGTQYAQDTWLDIQGHIEIRSIDGVDTAVIVADSIAETEQPEQPYLYF
jgi:putative membrane protein